MSLASLLWRLVVLTFALIVEGLIVTAIGLYTGDRLVFSQTFWVNSRPVMI